MTPKLADWSELAPEVSEYFTYEPRVQAVNIEGGTQSDPFGSGHYRTIRIER